MYCRNCGRKIPSKSKFCDGCGANQEYGFEVPTDTI